MLKTDLTDQLGVDAVKRVKDACPDVSVIVIGVVDGADAIPESLACSAPGTPMEASSGDDVVSAILQVFPVHRSPVPICSRTPYRTDSAEE